MISAIIVGAGHRAMKYGQLSKVYPKRFQVVGVADPNPIRREKAAAEFGFGPEMMFRNAEELAARFPAIPMTTVPGNCDFGCFDEPEKLIELGGRRIFLLHGHTRGVKYGLQRAIYAAREYGAEILLFGHTHCPLSDRDGALYVLNPGTAGGIHAAATYGVITITPDRCDCSVYRV